MSENKEIVMTNGALSIVENIDNTAVTATMQKIKSFQSVIQKTLVDKKDYGKIPGCGDKPTLLKPGAEKINMLFGTNPEYEIEKVEDFKNGFFNYTIKCTLYKNGLPISQGVGNCNSMEVKYRYVTCYENQLKDYGLTKEDVKSKTDYYGKVKYQVPNPEPADKANTILKMAKKRAFVDATLQLASLSDLFTQDLEDLETEREEEQSATMTLEEAKNIKINGGKYKGKTMGELVGTKEGDNYFEWCISENKLNAQMKKAFELLKNNTQDKPKESKKPVKDLEPIVNDDDLPWGNE